MNKTVWVIANWKSNKTISNALEWVYQVGPQIPKTDQLKVVVCPTFSTLSEVKKAITTAGFPLLLGAQDLSPYGAGAYTGEESGELLKQLVGLSLIGHSERRKYFYESDDMVARKVEQALISHIMPLLCVQDENTPVPKGCSMIAYEPIWAISTGLTNTPGAGRVDNPENANHVAAVFRQKYGPKLQVLYGGSVDAASAKGFITQANISGVLVGYASLDAGQFIKICQAME